MNFECFSATARCFFSQTGVSSFEFVITLEVQKVCIDVCKSKVKCLISPWSVLGNGIVLRSSMQSFPLSSSISKKGLALQLRQFSSQMATVKALVQRIFTENQSTPDPEGTRVSSPSNVVSRDPRPRATW